VDYKLPQIACSNTGDIHVTYEIVNRLDCNVPSYTRSVWPTMGLEWGPLQPLTDASESYWPTVLAHQDTVWAFFQEGDVPPVPIGMKCRFSLDRGASLSGHIDVDLSGSQWAWPRAAQASERLCVVWQKQDEGVPGVLGVYAARSDNGGLTWSPPTRVTDRIPTVRPSLASNPATLHCVWTRANPPYPPQIRYNKSVDAGATWLFLPLGMALSNPDQPSDTACIAVHENYVCVAWAEPGVISRIKFCRSSDNGENWTQPVGLGRGGSPYVSCDGDGVHLVYIDVPDGEVCRRVHYTVSHDWGQTWSVPIRLTAPGLNCAFPVITGDFQGRHVVYVADFFYPCLLAFYMQNDILAPDRPDGLYIQYFEDDSGTEPQWIVTLAWNPNTERDLCGYNVYRCLEDGPFQRLTIHPIPECEYTDIVPSGVWGYCVTAVDIVGNESQQSDTVFFVSPNINFGIGESTPSPYLVERDSFTSWGCGSAHDADIGMQRLCYRIAGLDPARPYTAAILLARPPDSDTTRISFHADGQRMLDNVLLQFTPTLRVMTLPPELYRDSSLEFTVSRVHGARAFLADVYLWDHPLRGGGQQTGGSRTVAPAELTALPNPARTSVTVRLSRPLNDCEQALVFDSQGRLVRSLSGSGRVFTWDGCDGNGVEAASGAYFVEVAGGRCRVLLLR
jgi:hypothetical protein